MEMRSQSLQSVSISNNWITGIIPLAVGGLVNLLELYLQSNNLVGGIPEEIFNLKKLTEINISDNNHTGEIPASIGNCSGLTSLDFRRNELSGNFPRGILSLLNLNVLNVSRNKLVGEIPSKLGHMKSLSYLDLSYNQFSGRVPSSGQLEYFNDTIFAGNPNLYLPNTPHCESNPNLKHHLINKSKLFISIFIPIPITIIISILNAFLLIRRKNKIQKSKSWKLTAFQRLDFKAEDVIICLKDENIIGKGGAGIVYCGSMPNGIEVAIKRLMGRNHGFEAEIQTLGMIKHRNIVRLLGYVCNRDTNLILYEFMSHGSLGEILHGPKGGHLQWETRYKIAIESAKGLCYLHHDCSPLIIHRDVKSNNILLDSDYEAHFVDFGLAKFMKNAGGSECMSSIAGSYGYIAPEGDFQKDRECLREPLIWGLEFPDS